jgi:hypothetical protein
MNAQSTGAPGLPDFVPVIIIGAGPTGITAATLLAQYGIDCLMQDRHETAYPLPRAVHADDEIYRILARLAPAPSSSPTAGPRWVCDCSTPPCGCWLSRSAAHSNDDPGTQRRLTRNKIGDPVPSAAICDVPRHGLSIGQCPYCSTIIV